MGVETLLGPQQRQEFYNMGREFAFEGLEKEYFKATSLDELEAFEAGYNAALETLKEKEKDKTPEQVEPQMKM